MGLLGIIKMGGRYGVVITVKKKGYGVIFGTIIDRILVRPIKTALIPCFQLPHLSERMHIVGLQIEGTVIVLTLRLP